MRKPKKKIATYRSPFHDCHRAHDIPQRLAHFLSVGVENHSMSQQRPVRCYSLPVGFNRANSGEKLALEPSTVLVRSFEANVCPRLSTPTLGKKRPRRTTIKPHVHGI